MLSRKKKERKREMWRVADAVRTLRENIEVVEVDARTMMLDDDDSDDDDSDVVVAGLVASSSSSSPNRLVVHRQGENSTLLTMSVDDDGNATIGNDFEETEEECARI